MQTHQPKPILLTRHLRSGLAEEEHFGFVVFSNGQEIGDTQDYPFFMRSCAKPIQSSLLQDYGVKLASDELALCCASHGGEDCHRELALRLLKKFGLKPEMLRCGVHAPVSKTAALKYPKPDVLRNNCSGKHIMMLILCKHNGWDLNTYDKPEHPLQIEIKKKIYKLCEIKEDYPQTKDGCGVPIFSMPLKNLLKGYIKLFCDTKYDEIKQAYRNNPYIIGGEDALDTEIMQNTLLLAKIGAGGLCCVINTEEKSAFVTKISDCDKKTRKLVTEKVINKLGWGDLSLDTAIKTLHDDVVGEIITPNLDAFFVTYHG